jgi:hypothetical protein
MEKAILLAIVLVKNTKKITMQLIGKTKKTRKRKSYVQNINNSRHPFTMEKSRENYSA